MHSSVALVANGTISDYPLIASRIKTFPYIVAVDGGLLHCKRMEIKPDLIIGDMDSVNDELLAQFPDSVIERFASLKDETDLELAVKHAYCPRMTVFGALYQRTDHTLANLHLLRRYPGKLFYETETEGAFAIRGRVSFPTRAGQTISLMPLGSVQGITSKGLKWSLSDSILSVSNIALGDTVEVSIDEGELIVIMQLGRGVPENS